MNKNTHDEILIKLLKKKASPKELAREQFFIEEIEQKRNLLTIEGLRSALHSLQGARTSLSRSLRTSPASMTRWNEAQNLLQTWLQENKTPKKNDLFELNEALTGRPKGFRQEAIFTARVSHIDFQKLPQKIQDFFSYLTNVLNQQHPLYAAFTCRYWILTLHPFSDGNGRTSQLFADYFLFKHGYLPQVFSSLLEAHLIADPITRLFMTPHEAFKRFSHTVMNAYKLVEKSVEKSKNL